MSKHNLPENGIFRVSGTIYKQADLSAKKRSADKFDSFWPELLSIPHKTVGQL